MEHLSVRPAPFRAAGSDGLPNDWLRPTLSEARARIEAEFGGLRRRSSGPDRRTGDGWRSRFDGRSTVADSARECLGARAGDELSPEALRQLCGQWGLPAEDLGLDPEI